MHAIIELKNGLIKFIYHETSMIIPISNAIYEKNLIIDKFLKKKNSQIFKNISFKNVDKKIFPVIKLKDKINEFESSSIIINAAKSCCRAIFTKKLSFLKIIKLLWAFLMIEIIKICYKKAQKLKK